MRFREVEILDVDEAATRRDLIATRLYGYVRVPFERRLVQSPKGGGPLADEDTAKAAGAELVAEMAPGTVYLIGPGTTMKAITDVLGLEKTLLGVDAVLDGRIVGKDIADREIMALSARHETRIFVGVTGGQGYVLGRGNQQISAGVIRRVGFDGITIVRQHQETARVARIQAFGRYRGPGTRCLPERLCQGAHGTATIDADGPGIVGKLH